MSQAPIPVSSGTGLAVRNALNAVLAALYSGHSGATSPASPIQYQTWIDTSTSPPVLKQWSGSAWVEFGTAVMAGNDRRIPVSNADYTVTGNGPQTIAYTSLLASKTVTLPPANGRAGQRITVLDETGGCSWDRWITIQRAGSDQIDGLVSIGLSAPYAAVTLISDGNTKWVVVRNRMRKLAFTSNNTWVCPPGVELIRLTVVGGGGSGAKTDNNGTYVGGGGGGGGISENTVSVTPGTSYTITIGNGGASVSGINTPGNAGASSSFGSLLTALGGKGGSLSAGGQAGSVLAGNGGVGNPGPFAYASNGGNSGYAAGGAGASNGTLTVGGGGASYGAGSNGVYSGSAPSAGTNTGGGGGACDAFSNLLTSGAGGSGVVVVEWVE